MFYADGQGLQKAVIYKHLRHLRMLIQYMSTRTELVIQTIENYKELGIDVSLEELYDILQTRYVHFPNSFIFVNRCLTRIYKTIFMNRYRYSLIDFFGIFFPTRSHCHKHFFQCCMRQPPITYHIF